MMFLNDPPPNGASFNNQGIVKEKIHNKKNKTKSTKQKKEMQNTKTKGE